MVAVDHSPVEYFSNISFTIGAVLGSIVSFPPFLMYPYIRDPRTTPFFIDCACPNFIRLESFLDSSWAIPDIMVSLNSLSSSIVLMLSF